MPKMLQKPTSHSGTAGCGAVRSGHPTSITHPVRLPPSPAHLGALITIDQPPLPTSARLRLRLPIPLPSLLNLPSASAQRCTPPSPPYGPPTRARASHLRAPRSHSAPQSPLCQHRARQRGGRAPLHIRGEPGEAMTPPTARGPRAPPPLARAPRPSPARPRLPRLAFPFGEACASPMCGNGWL